ncbi:hypothetical protein [Microbacterium sp. Leaf320]|uniref:hypothetical protein n=1 Tax=Microbacterium sp. Leaf320 TaxID=1736334 RepID=UPI0012FADF89|nr:hypothetical protein [Microbacterium sp. Leaf320]
MADETPPVVRFPRGWKLWVPALTFVIVGIVIVASVPGLLLAHWIPNGTEGERRILLGSAGQIVLLGLGGIIAVIGVALSLARHGQTLLDARNQRDDENRRRTEFDTQLALERGREDARATDVAAQRQLEVERDLRSRFVAAVELLGADAPVKRTAGLYALAALGDDWLAFGRPNELQVCIDVMCGYLRSAATAAERTAAEASVRQAGYQLIASHLTPEGFRLDTEWEGRQFPLSGAPIWFPVALEGIACDNGTVLDISHGEIFDYAMLRLDRASISGRWTVLFDALQIYDTATVSLADVSVDNGARVSFDDTHLHSRSSIIASRVRLSDLGQLNFRRVRPEATSTIAMNEVTLATGAGIIVEDSSLDGSAQIDFREASVGAQAAIRVDATTLAGDSAITFFGTEVLSGTVAVVGCGVGDALLSFDRMRLHTPAALDLTRTRVSGAGSISIAGAVIGEDAMILPNRRMVGEPGYEQPVGARVGHTELLYDV